MASQSAGDSVNSAQNELLQLLEYFNQQQTTEEALQPTEQWSKVIVETLQLKERGDIMSIDAEYALSKLSNKIRRTVDKNSMEQFFNVYLPEVRLHHLKGNVNSVFIKFSNCNDSEKLALLTILVKNMKEMNSLLSNSSENLDKAIEDCSALDQFKEAFSRFLWSARDIEQGKWISEILVLCQTVSPISKALVDVLSRTNLLHHLFCKISHTMLTTVTRDDALSPEKESAWKMLRGLTAFDYRARDEAGRTNSSAEETNVANEAAGSWKRFLNEASDDKDCRKQLHPMDILYSSFLCCDADAKQFLCQRLFACKLAFPFLYLNENNHEVQSDWALRDIYLEFEDQKGQSVEMGLDMRNMTLPAVSFMRIGESRLSKSRILNHLLSSESHNTFFNRDCHGGKARRTCCNGLVEASVSLPKKKSDGQCPPLLALNLRGDFDEFCHQGDKLIHLSQCCIFFVPVDEFDRHHVFEHISRAKEVVSKIIVVLGPSRTPKLDMKALRMTNKKYEPLQLEIVVAFKEHTNQSRPISDICTEICQVFTSFRINEQNLQIPLDQQQQSALQGTSHETGQNIGKEGCSETATQFSNVILQILQEKEFNISKLFPLQDERWLRISELERKKYSFKGETALNPEECDTILRELYGAQINYAVESICIYQFIFHLEQLCSNDMSLKNKGLTSVRLYLQSLRLLEEDTNKSLLELKNKSVQLKQNLKSCPHLSENSPGRSTLQKELQDVEKKIQDLSFDLHYFFREAGLLYEAHAHSNMTEEASMLPKLFASLLVSGVPLELLDGKTDYMPMNWILDVLHQCKELIGDKKLFVVSVLGTQSTGKSTLLNTMFGLRLPVSAGRCTRGAFLQLVPVDEGSQLPFHYLAVIDTEGLRAVERGNDQYHHDNELATLVIGLADLTIITISGEYSAEMKDILTIVIHTFIKMKHVYKNIDLARNCIFYHQNVTAQNAMQRLRSEITSRQDMLDDVTRDAAKEQGVDDVKHFSDIISFSAENDTFLMPNLWHGNPPMAPVNPEFSIEVSRLKRRIIDLSISRKAFYLKISDFSNRLRDMWTAVLSEDFVFSFRNSIEKKAYCLLDKAYFKVLTDFKSSLEKYFTTDIWSKVKQLKQQDSVEERKSNCHKELSLETDRALEIATTSLRKYFHECEYRQYSGQWELGKIAALKNWKEEFRQELSGRLNELFRIQLLNLEHEKKIEAFEKRLMGAASELTKKPTDFVLTDEDIRAKFEHIWTTELNKVDYLSSDPSINVEETLKKKLIGKLRNDKQFEEKFLSWATICEPATDPKSITHLCEIWPLQEVDSLYEIESLRKKLSSTVHLTDYNSVVLTSIKSILRSVQGFISEFEYRRGSFWDSDASQTIYKACKDFDEASEKLTKNGIRLNTYARYAVLVYACRIAYGKFNGMEVKFWKKHGLQHKLTAMKSQLFMIFVDHAKKLRCKQLAVDQVEENLQNVLLEILNQQATSHLKKKCLDVLKFTNTKQLLIKELLRHGIDEDVLLIELYIRDPRAAALKFLSCRTHRILFCSDETLLQNTPWEKRICHVYFKILDEEIAKPSVNAMLEALKSAEDSVSLVALINKFCSACCNAKIPLKEDRLKNVFEKETFSVKSASDFLREKIQSLSEVVMTQVHMNELPGMENLCENLLEDVWGCNQCCPLCNEPCIRMDAQHATNGNTPHSCVAHRPMGLTGAALTSQNELAEYTCNYFSTTSSSVFQRAKYIFGAEKKFLCAQCPAQQSDCREKAHHSSYRYKTYFPDWDIEPQYSAAVHEFWKFLVFQLKEKLVKVSPIYKYIPENWKEISKDTAKRSLNSIDFEV